MEVAFFSPAFWIFAEKYSSSETNLHFTQKVPNFLTLYFDYLLQYGLESGCSLDLLLEELKMVKTLALRWNEVFPRALV